MSDREGPENEKTRSRESQERVQRESGNGQMGIREALEKVRRQSKEGPKRVRRWSR